MKPYIDRVSSILRYFEFAHLPAGVLRDTSRLFFLLAFEVEHRLPEGEEKSIALRKLLEAKDAAVRSALSLP